MRRREQADDRSAVVPAEFRVPAVVEDWVGPDEIDLHSFGLGCPSCALRQAPPDQYMCSDALRLLARRRWQSARQQWLTEQGIVDFRDQARARRELSLPDGQPRWRSRHAGV